MERLSYCWIEAGGTGAGAGPNASVAGAARGPGAGASSGPVTSGVNYYNAFFLTDQAGTAHLELSNDGQNFYDAVSPQALTGGTPLVLTVPMLAPFFRARVANGAVQQTYLYMNTSITGA